MNIENITKDTKLKDILDAYPWLKDVLPEMDSRFKLLDSPMGKMFLRKATIGDLSKKADRSPEELIDELAKLLEAHK